MRDRISQYLGVIFVIFCFLLLSHLQRISATEPQEAITIQQENNTNVYEVLIPTTNRNAQNAKSLIISLPSYLREGFIADDSTCTHDEKKGAIVCADSVFPVEIRFRWDNHVIMEKRYCEEVVGDKQTGQPWVVRYAFERTDVFPWVRSVAIEDMHTDDGSLADTYADLTTKSGYAVLWSFGSLTGVSADTVEFGGSSGKEPLLGTIESIRGNLITLYIIDRQKHSVSISSAKLITCSVADISTEMFDQPVNIEYFGEDETKSVDSVSFAPLRFTYDSVESTFSPTATPTPTLTPLLTLTHTPSPTPTLNVVVVNSATATPIPQSGTSPTTNTPTSTPTFTPIPMATISSKYQIPSSNERKEENENETADSVKNAGGEVLGASTETLVTKSDNTVISMLKWIGAMLVAVAISSLIFIKKKKMAKRTLTVLVFVGIWFIGSCKVYATAPQMLVKITDPRTYYARGMGSIDLITYPPNFYFAGAVAGGRVVLSSTPDGTGNVSLGNGGFLTRRLVNWSSAQNFGMNPPTNTGNCNAAQNLPPRELPIQYFNTPDTIYNVRATFQGYCPRSTPWEVSTLYLVYFPPEPTATPTLTPTPTNTPIPTPTAVPPFLDLPWDYESDDWSFSDALLNITTFFDHEYPFISTSMNSPDYVVRYRGDKVDKPYTSHDGYDYANYAKVSYGDDQLAAAGGTASYHYDKFSGHAIFIDHGNGYQTRYYHMQPTDLVINTIGESVVVHAGEKIGKVGYSGNVSPAGVGGAHIHFMVIFDKNQDGDFQDNIPDGIVDPFGWEGEGTDPWETFQFDYAGKTRTGMKSTYLWKEPISSASTWVGPDGGEVKNEKVTLTIPPLTLPDLLQFFMRSAPRTTIDENTESIGSTVDITAVDGGGIAVKRFSQPINVTFTYSEDDALYYDPDHMSVYSSPDGALWQKEQTLIDHDDRTATATVDHLTLFALMGERRDSIAPQTISELIGQGKGINFHADVIVELLTEDDTEVDYTLSMLDEGEWEEYTEPVTVSTEGAHTLQYFSADMSGNVENVQTVEFTIDKTIPEIEMHFDHDTHELIFDTERDATIHVPGDGIVIAEDTAGNINELHYQKRVGEDLTTVEYMDTYSGVYAIADTYEYFHSGDMTVRKIPTELGRLSINTDDEITEDTSTTSLHIITNHGTLKIHD